MRSEVRLFVQSTFNQSINYINTSRLSLKEGNICLLEVVTISSCSWQHQSMTGAWPADSAWIGTSPFVLISLESYQSIQTWRGRGEQLRLVCISSILSDVYLPTWWHGSPFSAQLLWPKVHVDCAGSEFPEVKMWNCPAHNICLYSCPCEEVNNHLNKNSCPLGFLPAPFFVLFEFWGLITCFPCAKNKIMV